MSKLQSFIDSYRGVNLAEKLKVSRPTVSSWRTGRAQVPAKYCRDISDLSDGSLTVHDLRPDIFGPDPDCETREEAA